MKSNNENARKPAEVSPAATAEGGDTPSGRKIRKWTPKIKTEESGKANYNQAGTLPPTFRSNKASRNLENTNFLPPKRQRKHLCLYIDWVWVGREELLLEYRDEPRGSSIGAYCAQRKDKVLGQVTISQRRCLCVD